ncbi:MAG TPA: NUDIX domain-containing protein [Candidatus Paceibacterota bacterium]|nr:NUDIX domain-containing protein [Candidatus Paceibacterota bacterium]
MEPVRTRSAGGIVIGDNGTVVLVQSATSGFWTLPKGHVDEGETDEEAARREIMEEAGLVELEYLDDLGEYERPHILPDGSDDPGEIKVIRMFLFAAQPHAIPCASMEMCAAKWVPFRELADSISYLKDRAWLATVAKRIQEAIQRD